LLPYGLDFLVRFTRQSVRACVQLLAEMAWQFKRDIPATIAKLIRWHSCGFEMKFHRSPFLTQANQPHCQP
jgi:hypothetical protein